MDKNINVKSYFNSDAYEYLFTQADGHMDKNGLEILNSAMRSFVDYVSGVGEAELSTKMAYAALEGKELQAKVEEMDSFRHTRHEEAIANVLLVNRLAAIYNTVPVFTGDESDRLQIADFCLEVTTYLFRNRKL